MQTANKVLIIRRYVQGIAKQKQMKIRMIFIREDCALQAHSHRVYSQLKKNKEIMILLFQVLQSLR